MEKSQFIEYVDKYFSGITLSVSKKLNEKNESELEYRFLKMFKQKYYQGVDWNTLIQNNTNIAADIVSMNSKLPLKKRDGIKVATGKIPKLGMEFQLNESQLKELRVLSAMASTSSTSEERTMLEKQLIREIFKDVERALKGIYERHELLALRGLSEGVVAVDENENEGTSIRVDYGYLADHKFGVDNLWADSNNAKPIDDIDRVLEKARIDGNTPRIMMLDRPTLRKLGATKQMKEQYVFFKDVNLANTASVPNITIEKIKEYFLENNKLSIEVIDRIVKVEKNGKQQNITPWKEGMVVFLSDMNVGDLVWTDVAEMTDRHKSADYVVVDNHILLTKYLTRRPLLEHTDSQSMSLPVISKVDEIYQLDTKTVQA